MMETPLGNVSFRRTGDPVLEPSVEADADAAGNAGNVSFWLTVGEVPSDAEVGMYWDTSTIVHAGSLTVSIMTGSGS
jgi:hypothetical protein